jgi:hypothetical protein
MIGPWVAGVVYAHDRRAARTPIQPSKTFDLIWQASKGSLRQILTVMYIGCLIRYLGESDWSFGVSKNSPDDKEVQLITHGHSVPKSHSLCLNSSYSSWPSPYPPSRKHLLVWQPTSRGFWFPEQSDPSFRMKSCLKVSKYFMIESRVLTHCSATCTISLAPSISAV